jgi:hypothetical protein
MMRGNEMNCRTTGIPKSKSKTMLWRLSAWTCDEGAYDLEVRLDEL